jgi:hypothetical protein
MWRIYRRIWQVAAAASSGRLAFGQDPGGAFKTGATALAQGHAPGRALEERRAEPGLEPSPRPSIPTILRTSPKCDWVVPAKCLAFLIVDVRKTLIRGRAFQRAAFLSGLPKHDVLDFFRQIEILVGDSLVGMILEPDFDQA